MVRTVGLGHKRTHGRLNNSDNLGWNLLFLVLVSTLIQLDFWDFLAALGLMAVAIGLALWQRLGLALNLAIAMGRTVVQLTVVGYVLAVVFAVPHPGLVLLVVVGMSLIASIVARNRIDPKFPQILPLVWGAIVVSTGLTLIYTNWLVIQPERWYDPQYLIPLAGVVLGNAMTTAAIAGERLLTTLRSSRLEIETHLSLGATPGQAIAHYRQEAIQASLIPILSTMAAVGVVQLPGIMSGQILSGVAPIEAASYQILIMFMLAFANLVTALLVTWGLGQQSFNQATQLILD